MRFYELSELYDSAKYYQQRIHDVNQLPNLQNQALQYGGDTGVQRLSTTSRNRTLNMRTACSKSKTKIQSLL